MMFTKEFWKAAAERAIKSFAQGAAAIWGITSIHTFHDAASSAELVLTAGLAVAVLSLLTSIGSGLATGGGPSLTNSEVLPSPAPTPPPAL